MRCMMCGLNPATDDNLALAAIYRLNDKGQKGVWACEAHYAEAKARYYPDDNPSVARTPAGAAGDPVGEDAALQPRYADLCERLKKASGLQGLWAGVMDEARLAILARPASQAPTPSPESTLEAAQVAPIDGGEDGCTPLNEFQMRQLIRALQEDVERLEGERDDRAGAAALNLAGLKHWRKRAETAEALATTPASAGEGDLREANNFPYREGATTVEAKDKTAVANKVRYELKKYDNAVLVGDEYGYGICLNRSEWMAVISSLRSAAAIARPAAPAAGLPAERDRIKDAIRPILYRISGGGETIIEEVADAILATHPTDPGGARESVWHVKRGTEYEVLGEAEAQVSDGMLSSKGSAIRFLGDGDRLTVYRGGDGKLWCRFTDEFRDGRFEPAASTASSDAGGAE